MTIILKNNSKLKERQETETWYESENESKFKNDSKYTTYLVGKGKLITKMTQCFF